MADDPVADGLGLRMRLGQHRVRIVPTREEGAEHTGAGLAHGERQHVNGHQATDAVGDLLHDRPWIERGEDRLGRAHELALRLQLSSEELRLGSQELGGIGIRHRLGCHRRVDLEVPQVVPRELVETQLGQHDHADDPVIEAHRSEDHRLVEVRFRSRDGGGALIVGCVRQVLGDAVLGDPARDALAHLDPQLLTELADVLAHIAAPGHGDALVALDPVDAHVVVVDELSQLGTDGVADLGHRGQPAQARAQLLDRSQLLAPHGQLVLQRALCLARRACAGAAARSGRAFRAGHAANGYLADARGEEGSQVAGRELTVTTLVDADASQAPFIGPRPDGVGVDAQQMGSAGHGQHRRWRSGLDGHASHQGL